MVLFIGKEEDREKIEKSTKSLKQKANKTFKGIRKSILKPTRQTNARFVQADINKPTQRVLTRGQLVLTELMGGSNQTWGTGQNLPKFNGELTSGKGLIKNDDNGETGRMFGI